MIQPSIALITIKRRRSVAIVAGGLVDEEDTVFA